MERLIECPHCKKVQVREIKVINRIAFLTCEACGKQILVATPNGLYQPNMIKGVMLDET